MKNFVKLFFRRNSDIIHQTVLIVKHFFEIFQAVRLKISLVFASLLTANAMLSLLSPGCKHFFKIIFIFFKVFSFFPKEKVNFTDYRKLTLRVPHCGSPERRKRDLNPRAGFPTYTLSRGASSAS